MPGDKNEAWCTKGAQPPHENKFYLHVNERLCTTDASWGIKQLGNGLLVFFIQCKKLDNVVR